MALKPRYRRFVAAMVKHGNQTKAAEEAGAPKKSAHNEGSRMMKIPEIREAIDKELRRIEAKARHRAESHGITKQWWLTSLKNIADANIDEFIEIEQYLKFRGKSGKKYYGQRARAIATKFRRAGLGQLIKKIGENQHGIFIELHSKEFAYNLIGSHFGWKVENVNHSGGTVDIVAHVDQKELQKALKAFDDEF